MRRRGPHPADTTVGTVCVIPPDVDLSYPVSPVLMSSEYHTHSPNTVGRVEGDVSAFQFSSFFGWRLHSEGDLPGPDPERGKSRVNLGLCAVPQGSHHRPGEVL